VQRRKVRLLPWWVGLKSDGTDDRTLLATRGDATRYMQNDGTDDRSGTDDGDVALLGLRKFLSVVDCGERKLT